MKIVRQSDWKEIYNENGALGYSLITHNMIGVVRLALNAHAAIAPHRVPFEAIFVVLNGSGTLTVDGVEHPLFVNDSAFVPADAERGWLNTSDEPLEIQVIKMVAK